MQDQPSQDRFESPVSAWDHYETLKVAEAQVMAQLREIQYQGMLVALRVGYYERPPENQERGKEYKMDYGYLEHLDNAEHKYIETEEEWRKIVEEGRQDNPL